MENSKYRTESDLLGTHDVPEEAYYGVQTARAMENFHISGRLLMDYHNFIKGMASQTTTRLHSSHTLAK